MSRTTTLPIEPLDPEAPDAVVVGSEPAAESSQDAIERARIEQWLAGQNAYRLGYGGPNPGTLASVARKEPKEIGIHVMSRGDPAPYLFGRKLVKPGIVAMEVSGPYLYVDYLVGVGECQEFEYVQQGGVNVGLPSGWEFYLGTAGQAASPLMTTAKGETYDALPNMCHLVARLGKDDSADIWVMMKGLKLFDPRPSPQTTAYSNNPALALARVRADSGDTIDWDTVATVANIADEDVAGSSRWTVDLHVVNRKNLESWTHALSQYAACFVDVQGGSTKFIPNAPVTSSPIVGHTVTADDIIGGRTVKVGRSKVAEKVIVHFTEATGESRTAVAGSSGPGLISRLQLPGISTFTMAMRYAITTRNLSQADLRHEHIAFDKGIATTLGDLGSITYPPHGLSGKVLRLIEPPREIERGRWRRVYTEYDSSLYNSSVFVDPSVGDTELGNPNEPPQGPVPSVVEELFTDETATTYSRLKITFVGTDWAYVMNYRVTANGEQNVLNTLIAHEGVDEIHTVYTAALKQGVLYTIEVKIQSITGVLSEVPGTATIIAAGKLLPPGDVPWANFFEAGKLVSGVWGAAEEITGDLRGYTIKRLPDADHTGAASDWTHTNAVIITERLDAQSILTASQPAGTFWYCIKAVDTAGNESVNALCKRVVVTTDAWSTNVQELDAGTLTNMHAYTIDGDAKYVVTSTGETWAQRFGDTSPQATWGDTISASPQERWGGDLQTDSQFQTEVWDTLAMRGGNFYFSDENVTVLGGTQGNVVRLGDDSSPIAYTDNAGNTAQATARHMIAQVGTTDSPATAGDGLHIKLPIEASFSGAILPQSGTVIIADDSPLDNPKSVVFTTAYASNPRVTLTPTGTVAVIAVVDNISTTGFDLYLFDTSGNKIAGTVIWDAKGT